MEAAEKREKGQTAGGPLLPENPSNLRRVDGEGTFFWRKEKVNLGLPYNPNFHDIRRVLGENNTPGHKLTSLDLLFVFSPQPWRRLRS
jgi:hypothetical protein